MHANVIADRNKNLVAAHLKCNSADAKYLWVLDLGHKLKNKGDYDIGGTYSDGPEFWFMYRTRSYLQNNHLLSLFVCNRRPCSFTLNIGNKKTFSNSMDGDNWRADKLFIENEEAPDCYDFFNLKQDTFSFVKSFCFSKDDVDFLEDKDLLISISIETNKTSLSRELVDDVKLNHDFEKLLTDHDSSDLMLESSDGRKFPVHKIILAAHSSVFRKLLVESPKTLQLTECAFDVECLLQFIYAGAIRKLKEKDCFSLMDMGIKYEIRGLTQLSQHTLLKQISVEKAVDILLLAHTHQLSLLQKEVYKFIRDNPAVFESKAWANLNDVGVTKELFQYISAGN